MKHERDELKEDINKYIEEYGKLESELEDYRGHVEEL